MSKKLQHWAGTRKTELRAIYVVCGACGQQVSIEGRIEEGVMLFDNCPACDAEIEGHLTMGEDETAEQEAAKLSAEITWRIEGGRMPECKMVIGETRQVLDLLLSVLSTGVSYYAYSDLPQHTLYQLVATFLIKNLILLKDLPLLNQAIQERFAATPGLSGESPLYMAENGGRNEPLSILTFDKEDPNDDG